MKSIGLILFALICTVTQSGCAIACGPYRHVPLQRICLVAPDPSACMIRVQPKEGPPIDTQVPESGRVDFAVPIAARASTRYFLFMPVYREPDPMNLRVIRVLRGEKSVRKLSARDVGLLPKDEDGYSILKLGR